MKQAAKSLLRRKRDSN